jgi:DNA-binding response OmpR family regulator
VLDLKARGLGIDLRKRHIVITRTILLIEDDSNDALLMRLALERTHPEIRLSAVSNGFEARRYLEGHEPYANRSAFPFPELILLDLVMPVLNGLQVLRWIRGLPEFDDLPVIMLTSSLQNQDAILACEMGADSFIVKPLGFDELEAVMTRAVDCWLRGRKLSEHDWLAWGQRRAA